MFVIFGFVGEFKLPESCCLLPPFVASPINVTVTLSFTRNNLKFGFDAKAFTSPRNHPLRFQIVRDAFNIFQINVVSQPWSSDMCFLKIHCSKVGKYVRKTQISKLTIFVFASSPKCQSWIYVFQPQNKQCQNCLLISTLKSQCQI